MARFELELPNDLMADIKRLHDNSDKIFGDMTKAGAEVVYNNILNNVPVAIKNSPMMDCLKITKTYTKVAFYGYFINEEGKTVPAPLVANVFEYGRSNAPFPKYPFMRKSFNKSQIEAAMLKAQKESSGGIINE